MQRRRRYSIRPPRIFLSYRRSDSGGYTQQLYAPLAEAFGDDRVFMDTQDVRPAEDFWALIEEHIRQSDCVLAVIGPDWLEGKRVDARGNDVPVRLSDPEDFVRRELELAIASGKRLVPVLVGGATVPSKDPRVPDSLLPLFRLDAQTIHQEEFRTDVAELIDLLDDRVVTGALLGTLVATLLLVACSWLHIADPLSAMVSDWTMALGNTVAPARLSDEIVLVTIDKKSEEALDEPFGPRWRRHHATLVDRLSDLGARTIAFDITFPPNAKSDENDANDAAFAAALQRARVRGTRIVAATTSRVGEPLIDENLADAFDGVGVPLVGHLLGHAATAPMVVRRGFNEPPETLPSLALRAAYPFTKATLPDASLQSLWDQVLNRRVDITLDGRTVIPGAWQETVMQKQGSEVVMIGDKIVHLMLRLSPLDGLRARRVPYEDVVSPDPRVPRERIADKVVLVGMLTDEDLHDTTLLFTPEQRYGLELHADAVSELLAKVAPRPISRNSAMIVTAAMGWLGWHLRRRGGRSASPFAIAAVLATLIAIAVGAYATSPYLIEVPLPMIAFLVAYLAAGRPLSFAK